MLNCELRAVRNFARYDSLSIFLICSKKKSPRPHSLLPCFFLTTTCSQLCLGVYDPRFGWVQKGTFGCNWSMFFFMPNALPVVQLTVWRTNKNECADINQSKTDLSASNCFLKLILKFNCIKNIYVIKSASLQRCGQLKCYFYSMKTVTVRCRSRWNTNDKFNSYN